MTLMPDFRTLRPATLAEAVAALAEPGSRPLAGGTDLIPNLRRGLGEPAALVDLSAVAGLDRIEDRGGGLRLGAAATLEDIASHPLVRERFPALAEAALAVAGPTHRAAATLAGNLCQDTRCVFFNQSDWWRAGNGYCLKYQGDRCHVVAKSDRCYATYHGDVAPVLLVLAAEVEIAGPAGLRRLPLAELFAESGAAHLTLAPGELVTAIDVPANPGGWRAGYAKLRVRDAVDFPLAGVAAALFRDGDRLAGLRLAVTGTNSAPLLVPLEGLLGRPWDAEAAEAVDAAMRRTLNVLKTTMTRPKYRRRVALASGKHLIDTLWIGAH